MQAEDFFFFLETAMLYMLSVTDRQKSWSFVPMAQHPTPAPGLCVTAGSCKGAAACSSVLVLLLQKWLKGS